MKTDTVKSIITRFIQRGLTNAEVLEIVKLNHPHSKVSLPTINLYRNALRRKDKKIPTDRMARGR